MVCWILLLPIFQGYLMSVSVGEDPQDLPVGLVGDGSSSTSKFISLLEEQRVLVTKYPTLEEGLQGVRKNKAWACLYVVPNSSETSIARTMFSLGSDIHVWMDMSNQCIGYILKRKILKAYQGLMKYLAQEDGWPKNRMTSPIHVRVFMTREVNSIRYMKPVYGNENTSFRQFVTPGTAVFSAFYLPLMFTLGAMLMDKSSGKMERCLVAGLSLKEVMLAHFMIQFVVLFVQNTLMMILLYCGFDNPLEGNLVLTFCLLTVVGICGMIKGFAVAIVCDSFTTATFISIGSYFPFFMLSGIVWPLEGMHPVMAWISPFLPLTLPVQGYRAMTVKGWGLSHPLIPRAFLSVTTWTLLLGVLSIIFVRKKGLV